MDKELEIPDENDLTQNGDSPALEQVGQSEAELLEAHVAALRHRIEEANYEYYVKDNPTLTDAEYDQLMIELQRIEHEHPELQTPDSPTQRVGAGPVQDVAQHRHPVPMLSLANARSEEELQAWLRRAQNILPNATFEFVCELKIDGLAVALTYDKGKLTIGATRGDGMVAEDWTTNKRTLSSLPLRSRGHPINYKLMARRKIYMTTESFQQINEQMNA